MSESAGLKHSAKSLVRSSVPLALRKRLAVWLDRQGWIPSGSWWATELLQDLAERDVDAYHRFLWANHMAYAETYTVDDRFGPERIHPTRHMLFDDLFRVWGERGEDPARIDSVFEVGCSLGYLLRHAEENLFPGASRFEGFDVDGRAVEAGGAHLAALGSKVALHEAGLEQADRVFAGRSFDLVLCCGVLMYAAPAALAAVASMLRHTGRWLAISGLAHSEIDNAELRESVVRERDGTFVHNIDTLVDRAGGRVVWRRWEGGRTVQGNTVYFLLCEPNEAARRNE